MKQIIALSIAILIGATSCHQSDNKTSDQAPDIDVAEIVTDSVVIYNTYPGTLKANNSVDVVARVSGYLTAQNYTNGDAVTKGQLLFTIESTQYNDAVRQASAQLATAKSNYDYATAQYKAMKKALESDAVAQMEVNKAQSTMQQSEAAIRNAEAALQTAQTNLGYCKIRAPFNGHAGASNYSVGAFLNGAGSPVALATIYEDATLYAEFFIDDKTLQQIILDHRTDAVNFDSIPFSFTQPMPHNYFGRLKYIAPAVDPNTGTLKMRAEVKNIDNELHDGMYVTISLPSRSNPRALLIKDSAISSDQLGKYIYTVNDSGKVVYTPIKIGQMANDSMRVVTSGVQEGARYVTKAMLKVRDGMYVHPILTK